MLQGNLIKGEISLENVANTGPGFVTNRGRYYSISFGKTTSSWLLSRGNPEKQFLVDEDQFWGKRTVNREIEGKIQKMSSKGKE